MAITEAEKREIAMMTVEMLNQNNGPKISPDWQKLSKEIDKYIKANMQRGNGYGKIRDSIYFPIKYVLGLKDIRQITADQVPTARKIFEFIKQQREEVAQ